MNRSLVLSFALVFLFPAAAGAQQPGPKPDTSTIAKAAVTKAATPPPKRRVTPNETVVSVSLSVPPITRVRCSFDNDANGKHQEVEWDPARIGGLTRLVRLPGADADLSHWHVSVWAEPIVLSTSNATRFVTLDDGKLGAFAGLVDKTKPVNLVDRFEQAPSAPGKESPAKSLQKLELRFAKATAGGADRLEVLAPPATPGLRALDPISGVANELATVLAEIAVDRAKTRGAQLLAEQIKRAVCDELTWTTELQTELSIKGPPNQPLLPRTCKALTHLRVQEIASTAKALYADLVADLTELTVTSLSAKLAPLGTTAEKGAPLTAFFTRVATLLANAAVNGASLDRTAQLVLTEMANEPWSHYYCDTATQNADPAPECAWACTAEAGFAVLQMCSERSGGCTPSDVGAILETAQNELKADTACTGVLTNLKTKWPDLDQLVLAGLEILRPKPDATPKSVAQAMIRIFFGMLEHRDCGDTPKAWCEDLEDVHVVAVSVIDEHATRALTAAAALVMRAIDRGIKANPKWGEGHKKALTKVTAVVGAFTAYAATYETDPKGDAGKIKELHEARKKAIEGLVDATTDRTGRRGDVVVSLGINTGFLLTGGQFTVAKSKADYLLPQLQLPLGVAVQKLPDAAETGVGPGFHMQLSAIDLGQFAAYSASDGKVAAPTWGNFLMVGLELGVLIGKPSSSFVIGADVRYAPTLFATDGSISKGSGALRAGLFASYYVPFFDFN